MSLNNSELFVAIDSAFQMVRTANKYDDNFKILVSHLEYLLKEMQKRAKE